LQESVGVANVIIIAFKVPGSKLKAIKNIREVQTVQVVQIVQAVHFVKKLQSSEACHVKRKGLVTEDR
jgi:hypothetical protein